MIKGVQEGFTYKLKICSGHFPMSVALKGNTFEIKNFIGEKVPRTLKIKQGADVKIEGDQITVHATDKELAGTTAGAIEKLTRRPGFDKRIFQDGIYITEKDGKKLS
jgi:large subunit ribosomal protein L6